MLSREKMSPYCETIPRREVSFHPHSFADPDGRLFWWNEQLYRGISFEQAPFFSRLFEQGIIQGLVEKGLLIESSLTPLSIEGYGAVVRHKPVPFISYPQEWCAAMLKDAALAIIDLAIELTARDLTLKDAHPWNLLFDGCKPVFVDLTSIAPLAGDSHWQAYDEFCNFCLYPLSLMAHGHERIARTLLPEYGGVQRRELLTLARGSARPRSILSRLLRGGLRPIRSLWNKDARGAKPLLRLLNRTREEIEAISLPSYEGDAAEEGAVPFPPLTSQDAVAEKQRILRNVIFELKPASVLDISADKGWCSRMAVSAGSRVISFDTDQASVTQLYYEGRDKGWPILPLVMDFMKPTPSVGYSNHYLMAATDRLKCQMVLAPGLARRAAFQHFLTFDLIVEGLALFSTRWLVVDFTAPTDVASSKERASKFSWYTPDNFMEALKKRFRSVSIIDRGPGSHVLLLCEK